MSWNPRQLTGQQYCCEGSGEDRGVGGSAWLERAAAAPFWECYRMGILLPRAHPHRCLLFRTKAEIQIGTQIRRYALGRQNHIPHRRITDCAKLPMRSLKHATATWWEKGGERISRVALAVS